MKSKKIHFFGINTTDRDIADRPSSFVDACRQIYELPDDRKALPLGGSREDEYYSLAYFEQHNDHYRGKIIQLRSNKIIVGTIGSDDIADIELDDGMRMTEVTHFIYMPSTNVLAIEFNHAGARQSGLLYYINNLQRRLNTDSPVFIYDTLVDPDLLQTLQQRRYSAVKAIELSVPRSHLPTQADRNDYFKALKATAEVGNSGTIGVTIAGPTKPRDRTPLMTTEQLISDIRNGELDLSIFGKAKVEMFLDHGQEVINLLQNKLDSTVQLSTAITAVNAGPFFDAIEQTYVDNRDKLLRALGAIL